MKLHVVVARLSVCVWWVVEGAKRFQITRRATERERRRGEEEDAWMWQLLCVCRWINVMNE